VKHQPVKQGQTTTPEISSPTLSHKCVGSLTFPANHITVKMQETGPTVYSPYPRRPGRLTNLANRRRLAFNYVYVVFCLGKKIHNEAYLSRG